jgi:hypothetical protein
MYIYFLGMRNSLILLRHSLPAPALQVPFSCRSAALYLPGICFTLPFSEFELNQSHSLRNDSLCYGTRFPRPLCRSNSAGVSYTVQVQDSVRSQQANRLQFREFERNLLLNVLQLAMHMAGLDRYHEYNGHIEGYRYRYVL